MTNTDLMRRAHVPILLQVAFLLMFAMSSSGSQAAERTLFIASSVPATAAAPDSAAVELGVRFRGAKSSRALGIRFYKGPENVGTHTGKLWSSTGSLLGTATFTNETPAGWQEARFPSPVAIAADRTYVASYFAPKGMYSASSGYFATDHTSGILTAPSSPAAGGNGVYRYGATSAFPDQTWKATNYWVDVIVEDDTNAAPATLFSDGFETALGWTLTGDAAWYTGSPKNGTRSVRLHTRGYIQKTIPLTGYKNVTVSFAMGASDLDNNAENVQALYYNGSTWTVLTQINNGSSGENNKLNPYTFTLPSSVDNLASFALRFKINGSGSGDRGYVDDVAVRGTPGGAAAPTVSLTASPPTITAGSSSTLSWSSAGSTSCLGSGFATEGATSGSVSVTPSTSTTFTLACTGAGGTTTTAAAVTVLPGGTGISVAPPVQPSPYIVPAGAIRVTTSAQLISALNGNSHADIVLADGTYDHSTYFSTGNNRLWAENLGGAVLVAGVSIGGNFGSGGGELHGLRFKVSSPSKVLVNSVATAWGKAGSNTKVQDTTFDGNWTIGHGLNITSNEGLVVERCEFRHFTDTGLRTSDNNSVAYGAATARIKHISDIVVDGVSRPVPGSSDGTAEAGVWIGHPVRDGVQRIKVRNASWSGMETVNNSWDTTFSHLDIDMTGPYVSSGVGVYLEHFNYNNVFTNFLLVGTKIGFSCEWNDPGWGSVAGCHNTVFDGGVVDAAGSSNAHTAGFYLDAGTESTKIRNVVFRNQSWAGIGAYQNVGVNEFTTGNDFTALSGSALPVSYAHY